jgi:hypothetical protein
LSSGALVNSPIGLLTVVAAKAAGASKIFVFDLSEERLAKAKDLLGVLLLQIVLMLRQHQLLQRLHLHRFQYVRLRILMK